ncbi:hypothetical protein ACFFK0_13780 [Paenibacillus chartarius]|uniref:Uncharacterized protein n=1 Tax=Paenibacillus chartarius TaxID=747481 RepID=A0ABV6DLI9_9BACL
MTLLGIMEFIQSGSYKELKHLGNTAATLKEMIRAEQAALESKRMVWTSLGVVGQFQYFNTFEYDRLQLNEYLYSLGLLPRIACIEISLLSSKQAAEMKQFCIPGNKYVRYTPNRLGRINGDMSEEENTSYHSLSLTNKVSTWKEVYERKETLTKD